MSNKGTIYLRKTKRSKEHRKNISKKLKKYWKKNSESVEHKEKLRKAKQTPEFREKMRQIMLERHKNKMYTKKTVKKMRKELRKLQGAPIERNVKRINDYCGVVHMSDFKELNNG